MGTQGDFTITGYSSDSAMKDFVDGSSSITEGEMFAEGTADNTCVIVRIWHLTMIWQLEIRLLFPIRIRRMKRIHSRLRESTRQNLQAIRLPA
ncbi:hypothetical protein [Mediterraneibacter gnavus]|uniref:hypothetical protein n=1 Tax=Mediterraneibacter gnavus TaxID=33038 RepID=UPI0036D358E5